MARVVYVGPYEAVQLVNGTECRRDVPVELDDALAASLLEQDTWAAAPAAATTPEPNKPAVAPEKAGEP